MSDSLPPPPASSKLAEQATAKADLSYSFWTSIEKPANSEITPQKLTPEEAAAAAEQTRADQGAAASAWNSAGTFEERTVTEWAKPCLKECLLGVRHGSISITAVTDIAGDAHIWFIRGKKRHGFEFNIACSWQADVGSGGSSSSSGSEAAVAAAVNGTLRLPTASPDDLDDLHMEVEIKDAAGADGAVQQQTLKEARLLKEPLGAALNKFYAELKKL